MAEGGPDTWQESPLEVVVNSQTPGPLLVMLRETPNSLWLEADDFHSLHLRLPNASPVVYQGRSYYPLNAVQGMTLQLDESQQRILVQVPAVAFEASAQLTERARAPPLTPAAPGMSLSYQLSAQRAAGDDSEGGYAKLNVFGQWGVLGSSEVVRNADGMTQAVRLDSTYTLDFPGLLETLALGDAISNPGSWGDAVRFAGFHLGTNFGIRPDLITTPLLSAAGAAVLPSTVDVLVNNQRVSSQAVPPGPFIIGNVPPLSGAGEVTVVVRDALGREEVVTQSFYSGASLLASGLSQYSLDFGSIRENYALTSDQYGPLVGAATYRRGITDEFTLEEHAEFEDGSAHAGGLDAAVRTGSFGILTVTAAAGGAAGSAGGLGGIGFEHHAPLFSFTTSALVASPGFRQLGDEVPGERFRQQDLTQAGFNFGAAGSLSLAWVRQTYASEAAQRTISLSHYLSLQSFGALTLTVSRSVGGNAATTAFLSVTHSLGGRDTESFGAQGGQGPGAPPDEALATLARSPPVGTGAGYRLSGSSAGDYDADWRQQFSAGDIEVETARSQGITGDRALAEGTLTWLGGSVYAARSIPGSFAVVTVGDLPNVPIYVENQEVTRTDESGQALLPNLIPYAANRISIDPTQLPLDTRIEARQIAIAPPFMSGVLVAFPVERVHAGLFRLLTADAESVPAGAIVRLAGNEFPVALNGLVYVTGFDRRVEGFATWAGHRCRFELRAPPPDDPLPDMGTVTCQEAGRALRATP